MNNGTLLQERFSLSPDSPPSRNWRGFYLVAHLVLAVAVLGMVVYNAFVVMPDVTSAAAAAKSDRDKETERAKLFEDARKRQIIQEVELLSKQKQNILLIDEASRKLEKLLKKGD